MPRRLHGLTDKAVKEQKAVNRIVRAGRQRRRPPNKRRRWPGGGGSPASVEGAFALFYKGVPRCIVEPSFADPALAVATPGIAEASPSSRTGAMVMEWDAEGDDTATPAVPPYARLKPKIVNDEPVFLDAKNPNPARFTILADAAVRLVKGEIVTRNGATWFQLPTFDQAATIIQGTANAAFAGNGGAITITTIHQPGHLDDIETGDTQDVTDPGIGFHAPAGGVVFAIREVGQFDFTIFQTECAT